MIDVVTELAIRQLHGRYTDAVWRKDFDSYADLFTDDGEWKISGRHLRGRAEIRAGIEQFMQPIDRVFMMFGDPVVEAGDGFANCRSHCTEKIRFADGRTWMSVGIYYERIVLLGEEWKFKWRHWNLFYLGPPDFSDPILQRNEYGPPPAMPDPDEPSVAPPPR
jgi:ketosteroid isomerase-like protein